MEIPLVTSYGSAGCKLEINFINNMTYARLESDTFVARARLNSSGFRCSANRILESVS
jgi:hypothetical protein